MCIHAFWMTPKQCAVCTGTVSATERGHDHVSKRPEVPAKVIHVPSNRPLLTRIVRALPAISVPHCIGCHVPVTPGFCNTGSVLSGPVSITREITTPIVGWMKVIEEIKILGGEQCEVKITVMKRKRGFLCDDCAANYHNIERVRRDGTIEYHPLVKTDPLKPFVHSGDRLETTDEVKSYKRGQAFNTRYTQGRKGKRV